MASQHGGKTSDIDYSLIWKFDGHGQSNVLRDASAQWFSFVLFFLIMETKLEMRNENSANGVIKQRMG